MLKQGQTVRSPSPGKEGVAETTHDELTVTPIPCPPALLVWRRQGKSGAKLSPGRREGRGESVLRFGFISHCPTVI